MQTIIMAWTHTIDGKLQTIKEGNVMGLPDKRGQGSSRHTWVNTIIQVMTRKRLRD